MAWDLTRNSRRVAVLTGALGLAGMLGFASGCTSSRTFVLERVAEPGHHLAVSVDQLDATVPVGPGLAQRLEARLSTALSPHAMMNAEAADLMIAYRFVLFDDGSAAARVGAGIASLAGSPFYGLGDGAVGIEVVYSDRSGAPIGRIVVDGPIVGPFGSAESGLDGAAAAIACYTKANFLQESEAEKIASH